jgi:hypothetical protein
MAALFTSKSILPKRSRVFSTMPLTDASKATSVGTPSTLPRASAISPATFLTFGATTSATTTLAPISAKRLA